jgi:hypothetical protein
MMKHNQEYWSREAIGNAHLSVELLDAIVLLLNHPTKGFSGFSRPTWEDLLLNWNIMGAVLPLQVEYFLTIHDETQPRIQI